MKKRTFGLLILLLISVLITGCEGGNRPEAYSEEQLVNYLEDIIPADFSATIISREAEEVEYEVEITGTQCTFLLTDHKTSILTGWKLENRDEIVAKYYDALEDCPWVMFRAYETLSGEPSVASQDGYWAETEYIVYYDRHIQVIVEYVMPCESLEEQERTYYVKEWKMEEEDFEALIEFVTNDFENCEALADGTDDVRWTMSSYSPSGEELHSLSSGYLHGLEAFENIGEIMNCYEVTVSEENKKEFRIDVTRPLEEIAEEMGFVYYEFFEFSMIPGTMDETEPTGFAETISEFYFDASAPFSVEVNLTMNESKMICTINSYDGTSFYGTSFVLTDETAKIIMGALARAYYNSASYEGELRDQMIMSFLSIEGDSDNTYIEPLDESFFLFTDTEYEEEFQIDDSMMHTPD